MTSRKAVATPVCTRYVVILAFFLVLSIPRAASAHPMGNFSISHFSGIHVTPGTVELRYILDMAEIPTFQEIQATGIAIDPNDPRVITYLSRKAVALRAALGLKLNDRPLDFEVASEDVIFP